MGDWAKFAVAHLKGARGEPGLLSPKLCKTLQSPAFGGNYACGWVVAKRPWGDGQVLTHSGSNTMNYAVVSLAPKRNFAVLVATNQGGNAARSACDETAAKLIRKHLAN